MQFNNSSDKSLGLYQDALFLCGVDANAFPIADFTRFANRWLYKAVVAAWEGGGDWEFDDLNQSNFPIATTTLVSSQNDHTIPTNALKVLRVEVKDSAGTWHKLVAIDDTDVKGALDEFEKTDGVPKFYRMLKNSLWIDPAPDTAQVTAADGLKIYFNREVDEFAYTDTTQEPGIPEPFHRICSIGPAYDFGLAKGLDNAGTLKGEVEQLLAEERAFFGTRNRESRHILKPHRQSFR